MEKIEFRNYGSDKKLDKLVDKGSIEEKFELIKAGYGLDKLREDKNDEIRKIIAKIGREEDLVFLAYDESVIVKEIVVGQNCDKALDILVNDKDYWVRRAVAKNGRDKDLKILINDKEVDVVKSILHSCNHKYILKLAEHPNPNVALEAIFDMDGWGFDKYFNSVFHNAIQKHLSGHDYLCFNRCLSIPKQTKIEQWIEKYPERCLIPKNSNLILELETDEDITRFINSLIRKTAFESNNIHAISLFFFAVLYFMKVWCPPEEFNLSNFIKHINKPLINKENGDFESEFDLIFQEIKKGYGYAKPGVHPEADEYLKITGQDNNSKNLRGCFVLPSKRRCGYIDIPSPFKNYRDNYCAWEEWKKDGTLPDKYNHKYVSDAGVLAYRKFKLLITPSTVVDIYELAEKINELSVNEIIDLCEQYE